MKLLFWRKPKLRCHFCGIPVDFGSVHRCSALRVTATIAISDPEPKAGDVA